MSNFDASTAVEPLKCKLKPYAEFEEVIKEPSDTQIGVFLDDIKAFYQDVAKEQADIKRVDASGDPDDILAALNDLDLSGLIGKMEQMSTAYSKLCSGKPTPKQIQTLPLRVRAQFFAWLQNEVVSPEAGPGATSAQVVPLRTERAG